MPIEGNSSDFLRSPVYEIICLKSFSVLNVVQIENVQFNKKKKIPVNN